MNISNVIHRKRSGILHLGKETLEWSLVDNTDKPFLCINYDEIEEPTINPRNSDRAMIKLVLKGSRNNPFFIFADGFDVRDQVKDKLIEILTKSSLTGPATSSSSFDPGYCSILLGQDPETHELYQKLVETKVLSEEEFWEQRKHLIEQVKFKTQLERESGLASSVLADLRPQGVTSSSGLEHKRSSSYIKMVLTPPLITAIFKLYPSVEKAYNQLVPHVMSETKFWTMYGRLKFLQQGTPIESSETGDTDRKALMLLQESMNEEERAYALLLDEKKLAVNSLVDLWSSEQENPSSTARENVAGQVAGNVVENTSTIRKLNRVSQMMVQLTTINSAPKKKIDWNSATIIEDLLPKAPKEFVPLSENLKNMEIDDEDNNNNNHDLTEFLEQEEQPLSSPLSYSLAGFNRVITLLGCSNNSVSISNNDDFNDQITSFYRQAREILCHFWSCATGDATKAKRERMLTCLHNLNHLAETQFNHNDIRLSTWRSMYSRCLSPLK